MRILKNSQVAPRAALATLTVQDEQKKWPQLLQGCCKERKMINDTYIQ